MISVGNRWLRYGSGTRLHRTEQECANATLPPATLFRERQKRATATLAGGLRSVVHRNYVVVYSSVPGLWGCRSALGRYCRSEFLKNIPGHQLHVIAQLYRMFKTTGMVGIGVGIHGIVFIQRPDPVRRTCRENSCAARCCISHHVRRLLMIVGTEAHIYPVICCLRRGIWAH